MKPKNFKDLFEVYYEIVKPLYSSIQLTNELPSEVLFEINAALDHITRHWAYGETEEEVVSKAYSHFKRSCLDIFKLAVRGAIDQFKELKRIDTSIVDNGVFDRKLIALVSEIKATAKTARLREGDPKNNDDHAIAAFELWFPVYEKCVILEKDFYENPAVNWASKIESRKFWRQTIIAFILGVITSFLASLIFNWCTKR